jgi:hypothetical protein
MRLPPVEPLERNAICTGREEFGKLVRRTLENHSGAFFKILGKSSEGAYYATLLIDDEKILAVEMNDATEGTTLVGKPAIELLKEILQSGPVIVDAYPLNDVDVKMSVFENIDIYRATPKLPLSELCPAFEKPPKAPEESEERREKNEERPREERKKMRRAELVVEAPDRLEPYFRNLGRRLEKRARAEGIEPEEIKISAKEVRYALGAGTGVHITVELGGSLSSGQPGSVKQRIESFVYNAAKELSDEIGKKVVVREVSLRL